MNMPDFHIQSAGRVSDTFLNNGVNSFAQACEYITNLTYGRNANKEDVLTVFTDGCGTCSTKHALLKLLADENMATGFRLMLGIYKMNGINSRLVAPVLEKCGLEYIPEAHNYIRYNNMVIDCTARKPLNFLPDLLEEQEIEPGQITIYKTNLHKQYLDKWLKNNNINYNFGELWTIREACIAALSGI